MHLANIKAGTEAENVRMTQRGSWVVKPSARKHQIHRRALCLVSTITYQQ
jgi:hypothetical protein